MYKKLDVDFTMPESVDREIDKYLYHINFEDGKSEDWYRAEIDFYAKEALDKRQITREQFETILDYYVFKGILKKG